MRRLMTGMGGFFGSWGGWALGAHFGIGFAVFLSAVGTGVGVYLGWRIVQQYLS